MELTGLIVERLTLEDVYLRLTGSGRGAPGAFCFTAVGMAMSTLVPNQEAAGPVTSVVFFVLLFLSGLWYPHPVAGATVAGATATGDYGPARPPGSGPPPQSRPEPARAASPLT